MIWKKTLLLGATALPLLAVSCVYASMNGQNQGMPFNKGLQRTSLGVNSFTSQTTEFGSGGEADLDTLRINFSHGWFVTPNLEIGGMLGYRDTSNGVDSTTWIVDVLGRWYFDTQNNFRPYVLAYAGIGNVEVGSADDDITEYGAGVGATNMISESTSVDVELTYFFQEEDNSDDETDGFDLGLFFSIFY